MVYESSCFLQTWPKQLSQYQSRSRNVQCTLSTRLHERVTYFSTDFCLNWSVGYHQTGPYCLDILLLSIPDHWSPCVGIAMLSCQTLDTSLTQTSSGSTLSQTPDTALTYIPSNQAGFEGWSASRGLDKIRLLISGPWSI